jgi:hypothetical protein
MNAWVFRSDGNCFVLLKKSNRFQMLITNPKQTLGVKGLLVSWWFYSLAFIDDNKSKMTN